MKIISVGILASILVLQSCVISGAQTTNDAKIRKEIQAIIPELKSPWVFDSTNSQIIFYRAINQYSLERKFSAEGRTIVFNAISSEYDIRDARDMFGVFEKALSNQTNSMTADQRQWAAGVIGHESETTNHTITSEGRIKYVLWNVHPDWIVLETFKGNDFQIAGVHRMEPISFSMRGNKEVFPLASKSLEKKLKKFPKSSQ